MKRIVYVDMDNVLVDFMSGVRRLSDALGREYEDHLDDVPGIFALMDPVPGAVDAFVELAGLFDTYILSTSPWANPSAWSDKLLWVQRYLGKAAYQRLILTHHKDLNVGDFLIDDRPKHGADRFAGEFIHFGSPAFPDWPAVMEYMRRQADPPVESPAEAKEAGQQRPASGCRPNYYEFRESDVSCPDCGWSGKGRDAAVGEIFSELSEHTLPVLRPEARDRHAPDHRGSEGKLGAPVGRAPRRGRGDRTLSRPPEGAVAQGRIAAARPRRRHHPRRLGPPGRRSRRLDGDSLRGPGAVARAGDLRGDGQVRGGCRHPAAQVRRSPSGRRALTGVATVSVRRHSVRS